MVKGFLAQWQTTLILLAIYAVALGGATFIEASFSTAAAKAAVYNAWWFYLLHILLIANFIAVSIKQRLLPRKRWGSLLLHYGLVVVLIGALITHIWGYEGQMHIREGESSDKIVMADHSVREVPFSIELKQFHLVRYPGSNSPSSYESDVAITHDGVRREQKIYMNNIARVAGFRIYQTSYDRDERGTILTVNSDRWGTAVTYIGYFMLFAGLILALLQKGSRFRILYSSLGKGAAAAIMMLALAVPATAQTQSAVKAVDREHAERFGRLLVRSPDGRIEPVNTYSSELLRKVYHRNTYKGMNSDQFLVGLISDNYSWAETPIIYISVKEVAENLGAEGKHISFQSLFDSQGRYRLESLVEEIYQKNPNERTKTDKEYLKLDEKANILYLLFNHELLPLFPTEDGRWLSAGNPLDDIHPMDSVLITRTLPWYAEAVGSGNYVEAGEVLDIIEKYQAARISNLDIKPEKIRAEIFYNRAGIFRWSFRLYLILGFALMVTVLAGMWRPERSGQLSGAQNKTPQEHSEARWRISLATILTIAIFLVFLYQTFGIGLRWYISGRPPWANAYESMVHVGWAAVLAGLIFARRSRLVLALATLLGGVVLFVSNLNWLDPQITTLVPVLKSPWLMIHVSVITASYGFFGMCAMCGITSLVSIICGRDLPELRKINEMAMNIGLVLLTLGIFFGAIWANESWGRYWGWDPKETWALVTMIVYAFITHSHFVPKLNNSFAFASMSLIGFASVLMTFFGVNYYLSGLHSYGSNAAVSFTVVWIAAVTVTVLILWAGCRYREQRLPRS